MTKMTTKNDKVVYWCTIGLITVHPGFEPRENLLIFFLCMGALQAMVLCDVYSSFVCVCLILKWSSDFRPDISITIFTQ